MNCFSSSFLSVVAALGAVLCCSCQQSPSQPAVGVRHYSDAVVHIGQVDPAYRAYFRDQNAANYSLSEQRKAYMAAAETARTPVRDSDYRPSDVRKKSVAAKKPAAKGKGKKAVAKKGSASSAKKRAVAARKQPYRRR